MTTKPKVSPEVEILLEARRLIARPFGWTKNRAAYRHFWGQVAFCLSGAIATARSKRDHRYCALSWSGLRLAEDDLRQLGFKSLASFNDSPLTTKEDVLAFLDRAISHTMNAEIVG